MRKARLPTSETMRVRTARFVSGGEPGLRKISWGARDLDPPSVPCGYQFIGSPEMFRRYTSRSERPRRGIAESTEASRYGGPN